MSSIYFNIFDIVLGFSLLFLGGELLVRGSVVIARRLGLSSLLIGMTIVGFGTSSPELIVSVSAALEGNADIAIGNIVGSNIANILLILGAAALIYPIACNQREIYRDSIIGVLAAAALAALSVYMKIPWFVGVLFMCLLLAYLVFSYLTDKNKSAAIQDEIAVTDINKEKLYRSIFYCLASFIILYLGAQILIGGAVNIAKELHVSPAVIGLTMVALGTSLPELATSVVAAFRRQSDIAIGNILGSNLFNILGILGLTAAISPLNFGGRIAHMDVWIMLAVAILLLILVRILYQLGRLIGALLLAAYIAYIVWTYAGGV